MQNIPTEREGEGSGVRLANVNGRAALACPEGYADVQQESAGRFGPELPSLYDRWGEFTEWAITIDFSARAAEPSGHHALGPPSPEPRQVLAIALNYRDHADEAGVDRPALPAAFTKFPSCLFGPSGTVPLPSASVDWEVELVVVIGRTARNVSAGNVWRHIAGLTVGQDLSERQVQFQPPLPQFSLSKSFPGFGPIGPVLATVDEFDDPNDLELGCRVNGEDVQKGRTTSMLFSVPELIEYLSTIVTLFPGDLIFTGTPSGIGATRQPPQFLQVGDELVSYVESIGEMRHTFSSSDDERMAQP